MRQIGLILLLIVLALGGCAVTVSRLQPTINSATLAWVEAETRTDPIDDLVRFRSAERDGQAGTVLLPIFISLSLALLLLLLATPLPHILKEIRLLHKVRKKGGGQRRRPDSGSQPWLEQAPGYLQSGQPPGTGPNLPDRFPTADLLPGSQPPTATPPRVSGWLEDE